jgi:hypothetical protein
MRFWPRPRRISAHRARLLPSQHAMHALAAVWEADPIKRSIYESSGGRAISPSRLGGFGDSGSRTLKEARRRPIVVIQIGEEPFLSSVPLPSEDPPPALFAPVPVKDVPHYWDEAMSDRLSFPQSDWNGDPHARDFTTAKDSSASLNSYGVYSRHKSSTNKRHVTYHRETAHERDARVERAPIGHAPSLPVRFVTRPYSFRSRHSRRPALRATTCTRLRPALAVRAGRGSVSARAPGAPCRRSPRL